MSAQFGRCNFDGRPADPDYLAKAERILAPFGPDGEGTFIKDSVGILFRALHTTKESRSEAQPHITPAGAVVTWDGRLDNRAELIRELRDVLTISSTDVSIVTAAYERWGTACFAKLLGDWALSIWNPGDRSLILAKDPIGTRHLYYSLDQGDTSWSTILDPLVLLAGKTFALEEEYIAGWLSFFPATHLTPYVGIHSVPPSASVLIRAGKHTISKYWDFDPANRIRYRTDGEYEEHFRMVFAESVRRRLRSDSPILAELSGGMDSSSIVCMADILIARGAAEAPRLDTISHYDDSEPNWNERPYFASVEEMRGRTGFHVDASLQNAFAFDPEDKEFAVIPALCGSSKEISQQISSHMTAQGHRVLLSGIAGDEFAGGIPTPAPELANLLAGAQFRTLARQLKVWALNKRTPWPYLFFEAVREFLPKALLRVPKHLEPASWLDPQLIHRHRATFDGYETRIRMFGPPPSFQEALFTLAGLRRQLACSTLSSTPPYEKRYPFLDRDLLEFLCAIPREQLVRPGHRRFLMRRALANMVPDSILQRKRKAYISRSPVIWLKDNWPALAEAAREMRCREFGLIDPQKFMEVISEACSGKEVPLISIMRTLALELWLRRLGSRFAASSLSPRSEGRVELASNSA